MAAAVGLSRTDENVCGVYVTHDVVHNQVKLYCLVFYSLKPDTEVVCWDVNLNEFLFVLAA